MEQRLNEMFEVMADAPLEVRPSKYWIELNRKNIEQLQREGYAIFKRTPALYISERYLSSQFPEKRVFRFRCFADYSEIADELAQADIAFFLPHQLALLPRDLVDLSIDISSLHEMRPEQIAYYIQQLDCVTRRYCYLKEWKISTVPFDNVTITEKDYPIPAHWQTVFWRECKVQTLFFEAMFQK